MILSMYAFIIGDFFRRRRRGPRYERDDLPEGPLLQVLWLWLLTGLGGFAFAFGVAALLLELDTVVAVGCFLVAPLSFWRAVVIWWDLTRK
jgi:hypothetical protein